MEIEKKRLHMEMEKIRERGWEGGRERKEKEETRRRRRRKAMMRDKPD